MTNIGILALLFASFDASIAEAAALRCYSIEAPNTPTRTPPTEAQLTTYARKQRKILFEQQQQLRLGFGDMINGLHSESPNTEIIEHARSNHKRALRDFLARLDRLTTLKPPAFPQEFIATPSRGGKRPEPIAKMSSPLTKESAENLGYILANSKDFFLLERTLSALKELVNRQEIYGMYFENLNLTRWALEVTDHYLDQIALGKAPSVEVGASVKRPEFRSLQRVVQWQRYNLADEIRRQLGQQVEIDPLLYYYYRISPAMDALAGHDLQTNYAIYRLIRLMRLPLNVAQVKQIYQGDPAYEAIRQNPSLFAQNQTETKDKSRKETVIANPMNASELKVTAQMGYHPIDLLRSLQPQQRDQAIEVFDTFIHLNAQIAGPKYFESSAFMEVLITTVKLAHFHQVPRSWRLLSDHFFEVLKRKSEQDGPAEVARFLDHRVFNINRSHDHLWENILLYGSDFIVRDFSSRLLQFAEDIQDRLDSSKHGSTNRFLDEIKNKIMFPAHKTPIRAYLVANPRIQSFETFLNPTGRPELARLTRSEFKPVLVGLIMAALSNSGSNFTLWMGKGSAFFEGDQAPRHWAPKLRDKDLLSRVASKATSLIPSLELVNSTDWMKMTEPAQGTLNSGDLAFSLFWYLRKTADSLVMISPDIKVDTSLDSRFIENPLILLDKLYRRRKGLNHDQRRAIQILWNLFVDPATDVYRDI